MSQQFVIKQMYVRMPEELHRLLRHEAAEDDLSLNQCILNLLSEAFFESEERVITKPDGGTVIKYTPKLTGKGQTHFMGVFMREGK